MEKEGKEGSFMILFIVMGVSLLAAALWDKFAFIKDSIHAILDPTAGALLNWNLDIGMTVVVLILSLAITLAQKYGTDQETLREMKKEQKIIQEEMKKFRDHPEKVMELQRKQLEFIPKTMKLSMRPLIFTGVPLILFYRWFNDFFVAAGNPKIMGIMGWFVFYLVFSLIFSGIFRKILKVA